MWGQAPGWWPSPPRWPARAGSEADCVSAADILYDRDNLPLLERFHHSGLPILLADSRIPDLDPPGLTLLGTWQASTWPDLGEAGEYNRVRIFASEP